MHATTLYSKHSKDSIKSSFDMRNLCMLAKASCCKCKDYSCVVIRSLALANAKIKGRQIESLHGVGIHTFGTELYQAPPVYKACIMIILSTQVPRSVSSGGLIYILNEITPEGELYSWKWDSLA